MNPVEDLPMPQELWRHEDPASTEMDKFRRIVNKNRGLNLETYSDMHDWSVTKLADFWQEAWDLTEPIYDGSYTTVIDPSVHMSKVPKWFEGTYVNWAENILFFRSKSFPYTRHSTIDKDDNKIAATDVREGGTEIKRYTWGQVRRDVARMAAAMRNKGVQKGDRIAMVAANCYSTIIVTLATAAVGAVFSTSSTDMGVKGVLDRLLQIEPVFLFYDDQALYNGKHTDLRANITAIASRMSQVKNFKGVVIIPRYPDRPEKALDFSKVPMNQSVANFLEGTKADEPLVFTPVKFEDPLVIAYSSGTTGQPKCIVHCSGGLTLTAKMEARLHGNITPASVKLQYTTTGWIMFMASFQAMTLGGQAIFYDGSPFTPYPLVLIYLCEKLKVTHLGISPRYMSELQNKGLRPRELFDLSALESVSSTGMVLSAGLYRWFYEEGFPKRTQLFNIAGGTDLASAFSTGNTLEPVYIGQLQCSRLGLRVEIIDQDSDFATAKKQPDGVPGELTCSTPFPSMPVLFWGKDGAQKYYDAYFARFDNRWTHGDFLYVDPHTGGHVFLGRADGVLNPSGVRFGSAEIYNVLVAHFDAELADSICVGQRRPQDDDETVLLFLKMRPGKQFRPSLVKEIKDKIASELSKRHVPKHIFDLPGEIPTTINGKKVELPVKHIVSGKKVVPSGTMANPESLNFFYPFAKIEEIVDPKAKL